MPMAPEPAISNDFGSAGGSIASKAVQIRSPSGSRPGNARGRAPVAMMMWDAV